MSENRTRLVIAIDDAQAASRTRYATPAASGKWRLVAAALISDANVSLEASNTRTIDLKEGASTIATWSNASSGGVALTAGVPYALSLTSATGAAREIDAATLAHAVVSTHASGGTAFSGRVVAEYERVA